MTRYYAFNGDADGLCALHQLRLVERQPATLITGVKRDVTLLRHIQGRPGDAVTVLDVSLHRNRKDLDRLLDAGVSVRYIDHHHAGAVPQHPLLEAHIDEAANVCTSILADRHLGGRYRAWAVVAAFGDNLVESARAMALQAGLSARATAILERLGICLNYNAYGDSIEDLHFHPAELAELIEPFPDPATFVRQTETYAKLHAAYEEDMAKARRAATQCSYAEGITVLPNERWARRAAGVLINELAQRRPDAALAIVSPKAMGGFTVSVRVPAQSKVTAADFCNEFETGGGRRTAGGINSLAEADLDRFVASFGEQLRKR